jgi:hypothetical protein
MSPIHLAGEMAVWSEEKWAAFEGDLQRQLRTERRRLGRLVLRRRYFKSWMTRAATWCLLAGTLLLVMFY